MTATEQARKLIMQAGRPIAGPRLHAQRRRLAGLQRGQVRRLLVLRPDHLGDLLFATPALVRLRAGLPEADIALAIGPWGAAVMERNPGASLDKLLQIPFPGFTRQPKGAVWQPYRTLWRTARALRAEQQRHGPFDLALNLRFDFWWGALLCLLADIPSLGYATPLNRLFTSLPLPHVVGRHEVEQNLTLADAVLHRYACLPLPVTLPDPFFHTTADERAQAAALLAAEGVEGDRYVVLHPGAGDPDKQWTAQGWAAVLTQLLASGQHKVVLTGNAVEQALCAEITGDVAAAYRARVVNFAGQTSLGQLAAVLGQAEFVMGVDSGPMHLAAALNRPTLRLYGPSDATIWGPWPPASPLHTAVRAERLADITPAQVLAALPL